MSSHNSEYNNVTMGLDCNGGSLVFTPGRGMAEGHVWVASDELREALGVFFFNGRQQGSGRYEKF